MQNSKTKCVRCKGRKKIFKVGTAYSYTNTGGVQVDCPLCLGTGYAPTIEEAIEDVKKINSKNKADKTKERDCKDAENPQKISDNYEEA